MPASASAALSSSFNVQFTDNTTLKYSKMVNKDAVNKGAVKETAEEDDDDDDEVPMQQRVYDMPSSSSDEDEDEDEDEEEEEEKPVLMLLPVSKPKPKLPQFAEINVDDI